MNRLWLATCLCLSLILCGCITVGYSYAKNPNMVKKWNATIISIEDQNIYNSAGAFWVGPLATVESVGQKVAIVAEDGSKITIVQPKNAHYTLTAGEHVLYVVDQGHVWVQPVDYPLPLDFTTPQPATTKP
ncbi:MAG TPA: hypothetical protein VNI53_08545 [Gammaproteobacteria bacterium]|nr:hypothetical protein [Gammaproteobacteria bacterium]